jgi:hypothetical protein
MTFSKSNFRSNLNLKATVQGLLLVSSCLSLIACGSRREKSPEETNENAPFRVESFDVSAVQASKMDTLGLPAEKTYSFKACVQDSVMRAAIVYTPFEVSDGESTKAVRTDNNGCLLWDEVHPVDSLQNETLYKITRTIIGKDAVQGAVTLELAFNPTANDASAIQDLRKSKPVQKMTELKSFTFNTAATAFYANDISKKAFINVASLSLTQPEANYSQYRVNKLLTLQWARDFKLTVSPTALRIKLDGTVEPVALTKGEFRVQFLIVKESSNPPFKESDVITGFDQVIHLTPFPEAQTVTMPMQDPSLLSSRTKALIKISAVGESQSRARAAYYVAKVAPLRGGDTQVLFQTAKDGTVVPFDEKNIDSLLPAMNSKENGLSLFMKTSGFKPANMDNVPPELLGMPEGGKGYDFAQGVARFLSGTMSAPEKLDFEYVLRTKAYATQSEKKLGPSSLKEIWKSLKAIFQKSPRVQYAVREFVLDVRNPVPRFVGLPQDYTLNVANAISYSKSDSTSNTRELSGKFSLSAGVSTPGLDPLLKSDKKDGFKGFPVELGAGFSGGFSWSWSRVWNTSSASATSASLTKGQTLVATAETYEIAVTTKKCLLFSAPEMDGYIVCAKDTEDKTIRETYYLIDQAISSTVTRDGDAASSSKWRMKIRGTESFNFFSRIVTDPAIILNFEQFSQEPDLTKLFPEFKVFQPFPGMVSIN